MTLDELTTPDMLEIGRAAIEKALIDFRNKRISQIGRNNGCVVKEKDGTASSLIRFGPEAALRIGLTAMFERFRPMTPADIDLQQLAEQAARVEGFDPCSIPNCWGGAHFHNKGYAVIPLPTLEERERDRWRMLVKYAFARMRYTDDDVCAVFADIGYRRRKRFDYPNSAVAVTLAYVAVFPLPTDATPAE